MSMIWARFVYFKIIFTINNVASPLIISHYLCNNSKIIFTLVKWNLSLEDF